MGNACDLLGAGGIDPFQHLRIDGGLIVCEKEFQIARCGFGFRFREPVDQFVKLWFAHNRQCSERPPQMADSQWGDRVSNCYAPTPPDSHRLWFASAGRQRNLIATLVATPFVCGCLRASQASTRPP